MGVPYSEIVPSVSNLTLTVRVRLPPKQFHRFRVPGRQGRRQVCWAMEDVRLDVPAAPGMLDEFESMASSILLK